MRTTGITRRIDELGRVVIPKEIRRTMRLREGEEMEIFVEEGRLVLQKFSTILHLKTYSDEIADSLANSANCTVLIADLDSVISAAGEKRRDYNGKNLLKQVTKLFYERIVRTLLNEDTIAVTGDDINLYKQQIFAPVIVGGDVIGGIILLSENEENTNLKLKLMELSAGILGNILQ